MEKKQCSKFISFYREGVLYEVQNDFEKAMIAWSMVDINAPNDKVRNQAKARKKECLKRINFESLNRIINKVSTKEGVISM